MPDSCHWCQCGRARRPGQRNCHVCHAAYQRQWRRRNKLNPSQRFKDLARSYAYVYLKRGCLKRENCAVCRDWRTQMHHADYTRPLEVTWLCRRCHLLLHGKQDRMGQTVRTVQQPVDSLK